MGAHDHDRVPEESVEPILARAAELDRRERETVSVEMLRSAALEAGISAHAVDRAVEEYAAATKPAPDPDEGALAPRLNTASARRRAAAALAVGALAASGGAAAVHARTPSVALAAVGAAVIAALLVRLARPGNRPQDPD